MRELPAKVRRDAIEPTFPICRLRGRHSTEFACCGGRLRITRGSSNRFLAEIILLSAFSVTLSLAAPPAAYQTAGCAQGSLQTTHEGRQPRPCGVRLARSNPDYTAKAFLFSRENKSGNQGHCLTACTFALAQMMKALSTFFRMSPLIQGPLDEQAISVEVSQRADTHRVLHERFSPWSGVKHATDHIEDHHTSATVAEVRVPIPLRSRTQSWIHSIRPA